LLTKSAEITHKIATPSLANYNFYPKSPVAIVAGYGLDDRGVEVRVSVTAKTILLSMSSRPVLEPTQTPVQWVVGALSEGVKRPGRKVEHSPPINAEVKYMWLYTSTTQYVFMA
jgi:hypothetical protein